MHKNLAEFQQKPPSQQPNPSERHVLKQQLRLEQLHLPKALTQTECGPTTVFTRKHELERAEFAWPAAIRFEQNKQTEHDSNILEVRAALVPPAHSQFVPSQSKQSLQWSLHQQLKCPQQQL